MKALWTELVMREAKTIAEEIKANAILFYMDSTKDIRPFLNFKSDLKLILLSKRAECIEKASNLPVLPVLLPNVNLTRTGYLKVGFLAAVSKGMLKGGDTIVCVGGVPEQGCMDTIMLVEISMESELFGGQLALSFPKEINSEVFETLVNLGLELANEGREGKPVGSIFVLGDHENVLKLSRQMVFNPFQGYPEESRSLNSPDVRESLKEFSSIDGAFVIRGDGVVLAAGRHLNVVYQGGDLPQGLGTRHASAAAITGTTDSVALAISESTGKVTIFRNGQVLTAIERGIAPPRV
jgi:DNA integrity scanning protein DisA with diadenylate cyclase activity